MDTVDRAINIAARADDLWHLTRVAARLDGDTAIVGWLHDSVEDGYATEAELRNIFPAEIVDAVMVVTRRDGEKYDDYITRVIKSDNQMAITTKVTDLRVNLARARVDRFSLIERYEEALARFGVNTDSDD